MRETEAKAWLQQIRELDKEIDTLLQRRERYEALATRRTASYSDMPRCSRTESCVEYFACKLVEVSQEIDAKIDEYVDRTRAEDEKLCLIPDEQLRAILKMRYLQGHSWMRIADEIGLPESTVRGRMHERALKVYTRYCG